MNYFAGAFAAGFGAEIGVFGIKLSTAQTSSGLAGFDTFTVNWRPSGLQLDRAIEITFHLLLVQRFPELKFSRADVLG